MRINIQYFAKLRDSLKVSGEEVDVPENINNIATLIDWISQRGGCWEAEFKGNIRLRAAVNQSLATAVDSIKNGDEVAFFPPVTGG